MGKKHSTPSKPKEMTIELETVAADAIGKHLQANPPANVKAFLKERYGSLNEKQLKKVYDVMITKLSSDTLQKSYKLGLQFLVAIHKLKTGTCTAQNLIDLYDKYVDPASEHTVNILAYERKPLDKARADKFKSKATDPNKNPWMSAEYSIYDIFIEYVKQIFEKSKEYKQLQKEGLKLLAKREYYNELLDDEYYDSADYELENVHKQQNIHIPIRSRLNNGLGKNSIGYNYENGLDPVMILLVCIGLLLCLACVGVLLVVSCIGGYVLAQFGFQNKFGSNNNKNEYENINEIESENNQI